MPKDFHSGHPASRRLPLDEDPDIGVVDLATLGVIAQAITRQAAQRYSRLAAQMQRKGENATASAFETLLQEEHRQADITGIREAPDDTTGDRHLPPMLAATWEEISDSALLTPYRAFALAVDNAERRFAFYSYLAARADEPRAAAEAERLGAHALHHAAQLRRHRRLAWHSERRPRRLPDLAVHSTAALLEVLEAHEGAIARRFGELGARLRALGDEASAALLDELVRRSSVPVAIDAAPATPAQGEDHVTHGEPPGDDARQLVAAWAESGPEDADTPDGTIHLLVEAQRPLEALSETLESVLRTAEGRLFDEAEAAMTNVVERLSRLSVQIGRQPQG